MTSIGVVVLRNAPFKQVLQESVNNNINISNNDQREFIIVRKKKAVSPTVSVTSIVQDANAKRLKRDVEEKPPTPLAVARRNARERNRVRQVNDGFAALRKHIPEEVASAFENANSNRGPNKKLSKVETLRMAVEYIRNLESLLNIGHANKENGNRPSMESFPSPASSSPRDNSQERSFFSINSPALEDDDMEDDDMDSTLHHIPQQYIEIPTDGFHLVSTPHLYEEEEVRQPLTPSSDLLGHDENSPHILESHFPFPNSAEQFTVIPEQSYCSDEVAVSESDFEVKYSDTVQHNIHPSFDEEASLALETINPVMILSQDHFKFKEENGFVEEVYSDVELKKELPDIHVTPEDREQFEETLKWWQEKTRQARPLLKSNK